MIESMSGSISDGSISANVETGESIVIEASTSKSASMVSCVIPTDVATEVIAAPVEGMAEAGIASAVVGGSVLGPEIPDGTGDAPSNFFSPTRFNLFRPNSVKIVFFADFTNIPRFSIDFR